MLIYIIKIDQSVEKVDFWVHSRDLLVAKIGAELIPLIDDHSQQKAIIQAFETRSKWICDTTLNSSRNMGIIGDGTYRAIRKYFRSFSVLEMIRRFADLHFSLSLSDAFRPQRYALRADLVEIIFVSITACLLALYSLIFFPFLLLASLVLGIALAMADELSPHPERGRLLVQRWLVASLPLLYVVITGLIPFAFENPASLTKFLRSAGLTSHSFHSWEFALVGLWTFFIPQGWENTTTRVRRLKETFVLLNLLYQQEGFGEIFAFAVLMLKQEILKLLKLPTKNKYAIVVRLIAIAAVAFGLVWLSPRVWERIPAGIKSRALELLSIVGRSFVYVLLIAILSLILIGVGKHVRRALKRVQERRQMLRVGIPTAISCVELFATLNSLQSTPVRREYVELLRLRRVSLIGEVIAPPQELTKDRLLAEELSRLSEQWFGLAV